MAWPNRFRVTDAKIFLMSQGKYRHQRASESWIGRFGHKRQSRRQIGFPASLLLRRLVQVSETLFPGNAAGSYSVCPRALLGSGRHRLGGELAVKVFEEMRVGHQLAVRDTAEDLEVFGSGMKIIERARSCDGFVAIVIGLVGIPGRAGNRVSLLL